MPTILPISDIIEIGRVSTYLSANYVAKKGLFGGTVIRPTPPALIAMATDALDWGNAGGAQTTASLRSTANYAYWLFGKFQLDAQNIISGPGGGSVIPTPSGGGAPNDLDFKVSSTSFIKTGETSVSIPQFIGYNVDFSRSGIMQNTTNPGDGGTYYGWNNVTGLFELFNGAAQDGELFRIMVDAGGSGSVIPTQTYPFIITSADFEPDGITYNNPAIVGDQLMLFITGYNQEWQFAPTSFSYTATGIQIDIPGFDAANYGNIIIQKIN